LERDGIQSVHLNLSYIRSIAGVLDRVCDRLHTLNVNWVTQIHSYVRQMPCGWCFALL
jgi:hypothetical protein